MGALLLRRPEELHGWTNALRGGVEDCTNTTITDDWNMKILAHLPSVFDRHRQQKTPGHPGLKPDWKNTTDVFVAQLKPHIASGKALGVFMGDEKVCGGVPYDDFSIVGAPADLPPYRHRAQAPCALASTHAAPPCGRANADGAHVCPPIG